MVPVEPWQGAHALQLSGIFSDYQISRGGCIWVKNTRFLPAGTAVIANCIPSKIDKAANVEVWSINYHNSALSQPVKTPCYGVNLAFTPLLDWYKTEISCILPVYISTIPLQPAHFSTPCHGLGRRVLIYSQSGPNATATNSTSVNPAKVHCQGARLRTSDVGKDWLKLRPFSCT